MGGRLCVGLIVALEDWPNEGGVVEHQREKVKASVNEMRNPEEGLKAEEILRWRCGIRIIEEVLLK
jgi:hypothetical protein